MEKKAASIDDASESSCSDGGSRHRQSLHRQQSHTRLDFRTDVLYGRDDEVRALLDAFQRILGVEAEGATHANQYADIDSPKVEPDSEPIHQSSAVLISGYSGTGKSSLSRHLRRPVEQIGGKFLAGKFDQLREDNGGEPYSAVAFAFDGICKAILNGSAEDINRTREKIVSALGTEAGLLTEILPSLDRIIGEQPTKTTVSGTEAQNRLKFAFRALARSICSPEAPAVVVLDDLQWADEPSLELIRTLMVEEEEPKNKHTSNVQPPSSILFVLCYRDNEVDMSHPLSFLISDLRSAGVSLTEIKLENLSREDTNDLISEVTHMEKSASQPLTDIVYRKTQGNCFFVVQFLNSLCRDGLLYRILSGDSDSNNDDNKEGLEWEWRWNEAVISSKGIPDDVVDLMAGRIRKLTPGARDVLQVAACIGSMFDATILLLVFDSAGERRRSTIGSYAFASLRPRSDISQNASEDIKRSSGGNSELFRLLDLIVKEGLIDVILPRERFRFAHDKIQQAAYSLITSKRRASYHYNIGDLIVHKTDKAQLERMLFVATDQLNRGKSLITTRMKRIDLAALNLRAGEKAMSSAAFVTASKYLRTGIELLGGQQSKWLDEFELCMRLHNAAAEAEYTRGSFVAMEEVIAEIFKHARSLYERLPAHLIYISSLKARMKWKDALAAGIRLLKQLGETFPNSPGRVSIMSTLLKTKYIILRDKSCNDLSVLPLMQDENASAKMLVMDSIMQLAFLCKRKLFPLIILRMIQLSVRLGLHRKSAVAFAAYGMLLCGHLRDTKEGNEFANLALSVVARFRANELLPQVSMVVYYFCTPQQTHIKQSLEPLRHGYRTGLQVGDVHYGLMCSLQFSKAAIHSGMSLVSLETEMMTFAQQMKHHKQEAIYRNFYPPLQYVQNMLGRSNDPTKLTGETMNEDDFLKQLPSGSDTKNLLCYVQIYKMKLAYFFDDIELAVKMAEASRNIAFLSPASFDVYDHAFFEALISCEMARRCSKRMRWERLAKRRLKCLKKAGQYAMANCQQKVLLIKAEIFALKKQHDKASKAFEDAIAAAGNNDFINDEAMAHERAWLFFESTGDHFKSSHHYVRAYNCFLEWGAEGKAEQLYKERTRKESASGNS